MAAIGSPPGTGFDEYTAEVYGWAYRLLGHHHDALDVVQDVFLRYRAQCARQAPEHPLGWLRRVTINRAIDLRRRRGTEAEPQSRSVECASPRDEPRAQIDRKLLRDDIAEALNRLSDVQRSVLVAKVYDEMTFAAIAAELGLALSTVKTHYLRSVRAVRDRLQRRWGEENA